MIRPAHKTKDLNWFRNVGTTGVLGERWYSSGHIQTNAYTATVLVANRLYALPYISGRGGVIDRIGANVTIAVAAAKLRIGIYRMVSETDIGPGMLIVDSGEIDASVLGVKTVNISVPLETGVLYWFAALSGHAITMRAGLPSSMMNIIANDNTFGTSPGQSIYAALTYAALPATFTTPVVVQTTTPHPIVYVRYSA